MTIENDFIKELRAIIEKKHRGYQIEIANAMKIKASTLSNMVCGRRGMDEELRRKVAAYVGMNYDRVATYSPNTRQPPSERGSAYCSVTMRVVPAPTRVAPVPMYTPRAGAT